jgi:hypothetical protein
VFDPKVIIYWDMRDQRINVVGEKWLCILAQLTPVQPDHYPADETIVVKYLDGVLQ